jgi:hypothetical protein
MVDKSDWPISNRAKTGSKTKGSSVEVLTIGDAFDSPDAMRDGVNIRNYNDITKRIYTMRGDGQEELTVNGKTISDVIFDDTHAPALLMSTNTTINPNLAAMELWKYYAFKRADSDDPGGGITRELFQAAYPRQQVGTAVAGSVDGFLLSSAFTNAYVDSANNEPNNYTYFEKVFKKRYLSCSAISFQNRKIRMERVITHRRRKSDFGQTTYYEDKHPYFDTLDDSPLAIIKTKPEKLELPPVLADHTSDSAMDGTIEFFNVRSSLDQSSIEAPFYSKGIFGYLGSGDVDNYRRNQLITEGFEIEKFSDKPEFFWDNSDQFENLQCAFNSGVNAAGLGVTGSFIKTLTTPGRFPSYTPTRKPFEDKDNNFKKFTDKITGDVSLKNVILSGSVNSSEVFGGSYVDGDYDEFNYYPTSGFIYGNEKSSIDSIAFGGLLK